MSSPTSPTFSTTSHLSDSDRSLDALFRSYSIQEVSRTLSKLRLQNTRLKADLYTLVSEYYGKILEAADAVEAMKEAANEIKSGLDFSLEHISRVPSAVASPAGDKKVDDARVLAKKVMNGPLDVWKLFEKRHAKEAFIYCENILSIINTNDDLPLDGHFAKIVGDQMKSLQNKIKSGCLAELFDCDSKKPTSLELLKDTLALQLKNLMASPSNGQLGDALARVWAEQVEKWKSKPAIDHAKLLEKNCQLLSFANQLNKVDTIDGSFRAVLDMMVASKKHAMADQILARWIEEIPVLREEADKLFEEWYQLTLNSMRSRGDEPLYIMFEFGKEFSSLYQDENTRKIRSCAVNSSLCVDLKTKIPIESFLLLAPLFATVTSLPSPKTASSSQYKTVPAST